MSGTTEKKLKELFRRWQFRPDLYVPEVIFAHAADGKAPSKQQMQLLTEVGRLAYAKYKTALHAKGIYTLGKEIEPWVPEYAKKKGIAVRSGHGCGKDAALSWIYLWLLNMFSGARGLVTAPTSDQLNTILWSEFRRWIRYTKNNSPSGTSMLDDLIEVQNDMVFVKERKGETFILGKTANIKGDENEQGEALAGQHSQYMILAADEASGLPRGVFKPLEGAMTQGMNFAILIGNPTRGNGYFYDCFNSDRSRWICIHWNSEESELVNQEDLKADQEKYGRNSNFYRTRRLGEFPLAEPDTLIPLEWVEAAVNKEIVIADDDPTFVGVDPARFGDDKSAYAIRQGHKLLEIKTLKDFDTMKLAGFVASSIEDTEYSDLAIDPIGIGAGVYDRIREMGYKVTPVTVSEKARDPERFYSLRDELWWTARELFEKGLLSVPRDDDLIAGLTAPKFQYRSDGRIKVESKADMRKRGVGSPDEADAFLLTLFFRDSSYRSPINRRRNSKKPQKEKSATGWMAA